MKKLLTIILSLSLFACSSNNKKPVRSADVTTISAPYELLLVADKDWIETDDGMTVMTLLKSDVEVLPQSEACFRVININPSGFNKRFRCYGEILIIDKDTKYENANVSVKHDVYAHPQTIITITAHDGQQVAELISTQGRQILQTFIDAELQREVMYLKNKHSDKVLKQAQKQFGLSIFAPEDINSIKTGKDFFWASSMDRDNMLNICMYSLPLDSLDSTEGIMELTIDSFLVHRNTMMKANVKGSREDRYMTTQPLGLMGEIAKEGGGAVLRVRGLWEMENDAMGGPFVSYTWIDTERQRVLVAEGFVYAPQRKKRELIRELEAALRTISLIDK